MNNTTSTEKIDIHRSAASYETALHNFSTDHTISSENKAHIERFLRACSLGQTVLQRQKKKIQPRRLLKYLHTLKALSVWLGNKDFATVIQQEMEDFITRLDSNQLRSTDGRPHRYAAWSRRDIKVCLRKFYKWLLGDNKTYPSFVSWIDTSIAKGAPPSFSLEEIRGCIERCSATRSKALCWTLFETGARAEEFLNIRVSHVHDKRSHFSVWIEYPKTFRRSVPVFEGASLLRQWLVEHPTRDDPNSRLFPMSYSALRQFLNRLGERALRKRLTPQLMRDSFATWLASRRVGRYQMCKVMGWSMSSDMPDRYIDRTGVVEEEAIRSIRGDALNETEKENRELKTTLVRLEAQCHDMQDRLAKRAEIDEFLNALLKDDRLRTVLAASVKKQKLGDQLMDL